MQIEKLNGNAPTPSSGEQQLINLQRGNFEIVVFDVDKHMQKGNSPGALSILRTDLMTGFAREWKRLRYQVVNDIYPQRDYKAVLFDRHLYEAEKGKPEAIQALPKFATSASQVNTAMELVLAYGDDLAAWQQEQEYLQYTGAFDPQHVGHRIAIASALERSGKQTNALIQIMGQHPRKPTFAESYQERYVASEEKLYRSPLLDVEKTTQIDIPGGVGLGAYGVKQLQLIADTCGDPLMRWLIGSDKFILDALNVRSHSPNPKALQRFTDPRLHAYVIHRQSDNLVLLEELTEEVRARYNTKITLLEEKPYDCAPASSTKIKQLRASGNNDAANHMEYYELIM